MFGLLFGVRNLAQFEPIAAERGVPDDDWNHYNDIDEDDFIEGCHSHSYILASEISSIDWEQESSDYFDGTFVYEDGKEEWIVGYAYSSNKPNCKNGEEIRIGNKIYRSIKMKQKDALSEEWKIVFDMIKLLSDYHGEDSVRMIVGFW